MEESDDSKSIFIIETVRRAISDGHAVILVSESDPRQTIEMLERKGFDAIQYINRGVLTVLDNGSTYAVASTQLDANKLIYRWIGLISDIKEKSGCQGIIVIGTPRLFIDTNNIDKLMMYERQIGRKFNIPLEAVCCYDAVGFSKLGFTNMIRFLNYHEYTIYQGGVFFQWQPSMILRIIDRAIDDVLGPGTSRLLLKTLKLVYNADRDSIVSKPELFEAMLRGVFGKTATIVLDNIQREITKELMYLRNAPKGED
ncbi:MAG TPA: MEDS domain-containing protein [Nitrososphaera sp.]|nr:MEDS domain-containing protein [Nitrososphaera sp.]